MNIEETLSRDESTGESSGKTLSYLIREARISVNLSQRAFAKKLDITQAQLSRLEKGTAKKPNRRTLKALLPYLKDISYEDLLAMVGYSADFMTESAKDENLVMFSEEEDSLAIEFGNINSELYESAKGLWQYLDDPKNIVLIQKIFKMVKAIGIKENSTNEENIKLIYLRDCILNLLQ